MIVMLLIDAVAVMGNSLEDEGIFRYITFIDVFFTSCGSLIPFTRANTQWVVHGFN